MCDWENAAPVVEPDAGAEITLARLTAFLERHAVTKAFWPEELVAVERLPRSDVGKWVRADVSRLAAYRLDTPKTSEEDEDQ